MPKLAILFGAILIGLGIIAYAGSSLSADANTNESDSSTLTDAEASQTDSSKKKRSAITGLIIPAAFGSLLLVCGLVGQKESLRKHAMHAAAMVGLLGAIATLGKGSYDVYKMVSGMDVNGRAMTFVWLMAIICLVFVGLCVKSFVDARKQREAAQATE